MKINGVLITGAAGFLGTNLAEFYMGQNISVIGVDNFCTGMKSNVDYLRSLPTSRHFTFIEEDVVRPWTWAKIIGPDYLNQISHIFHLASPASPPLYQAMALETLWVNSIGLKNAIEFADSIGARVVFSSTSEIYGDPSCSPQPESYWGNVNSFGVRSCYDEAKRFGEALLFTHNWKKKTQHGLVRIFNTYGPRMNPVDGRVIINFLTQALKGEKLTVYGEGRQTRSFCYVTDLIDGIHRYAQSDLTVPINLGNDKEFTILELVEEVKKIFPNKNLSVTHKPIPGDDPKQRRPDLTLARKLLSPWAPKTPLSEGLEKMTNWLQSTV